MIAEERVKLYQTIKELEDEFATRDQTAQTILMNKPKRTKFYNPNAGLGLTNPHKLEQAASLLPNIYNALYVGLGIKSNFLKSSEDCLNEEDNKREYQIAKRQRVEVPFDYTPLNWSYVDKEAVTPPEEVVDLYPKEESIPEPSVSGQAYIPYKVLERRVWNLETELKDLSEKHVKLLSENLSLVSQLSAITKGKIVISEPSSPRFTDSDSSSTPKSEPSTSASPSTSSSTSDSVNSSSLVSSNPVDSCVTDLRIPKRRRGRSRKRRRAVKNKKTSGSDRESSSRNFTAFNKVASSNTTSLNNVANQGFVMNFMSSNENSASSVNSSNSYFHQNDFLKQNNRRKIHVPNTTRQTSGSQSTHPPYRPPHLRNPQFINKTDTLHNSNTGVKEVKLPNETKVPKPLEQPKRNRSTSPNWKPGPHATRVWVPKVANVRGPNIPWVPSLGEFLLQMITCDISSAVVSK